MEMRKKITEFTENEYKEFFSWIFDTSSIEIQTEYDFSKSLEFENPYIYYTPEIKAFFETKAMKRLGKIGQIPNVLLTNANTFQDRLEHCKGAYQKILDFYMMQFKKERWKYNNSNRHSKLKVLADIMDMASHDIGHNIGSHALESFLGSQKGAHEILGDRILHENSEVVQALYNIHPNLLSYLDIVKKQEYNLHTLKEGNVDFDRADFLTRDSLYYGMENGFELHSDEESMPVVLDSIMEGCNIFSIKNGDKEFECPAFSYKVEPQIETFLKRRIQSYQNIYISKYTRPNDSILEEFCKSFVNCNENVGNDLKQFLIHISSNPIETIDLNLFLDWNGIKFYNSVFDIAENSKDVNLRNFAMLCIPTVESMKSIVQNKIFPQITPDIDENGNEIDIQNKIQSEEDRKFYLKVKDIVKKHDERYYRNRIGEACFGACFSTQKDNDDFLQKLKSNYGVSDDIINKLIFCRIKIKTYNKNEPIFIYNEDGKIYTFDEYPERKLDITPQESYLIFGIRHKLLLEGIKKDDVDLLSNIFGSLKDDQKIDFNYQITDTRLTSELIDMKYKKQEADAR